MSCPPQSPLGAGSPPGQKCCSQQLYPAPRARPTSPSNPEWCWQCQAPHRHAPPPKYAALLTHQAGPKKKKNQKIKKKINRSAARESRDGAETMGQDPAGVSLSPRSPEPGSWGMDGADAVVAEPVHQLSSINFAWPAPTSRQPPPPAATLTPPCWHTSPCGRGHAGGSLGTGTGPLQLLSPLQEQSLSAGTLLPKIIIKTRRGARVGEGESPHINLH